MQLNAIFDQASVELQNDFTKLIEDQKFYGTGKTAERLQARDLAAFGRSQALTSSNLVRAREGYDRDVTNIRQQLKSANRKTLAPVQFKPQPGLPPVKPNTDMTAANLGALGTIVGGASDIYGKEEGFAPVDVPDITPYINENLEKLRQSEKQNIQDKFTVDKQRATELGSSLKQLGSLSKTAGDFFHKRELEFREKETTKMQSEEFRKYMQDPEAYVGGLFDEQVNEVRELNKATEDLGGRTYENTGNHEVATQVRELSGWREIRTAQIQLNLASQYYESWLPKQLLGNEQITDQKSRGAAIELARETFMKQFGLNGFSNDMLGTHLYPAQRQLHAKMMKDGSALDLQNQKRLLKLNPYLTTIKILRL